jgi:hypothetical protein
VNSNDLVADLQMQSMWTMRRYTIKNILPKYGTGIFRIDAAGYLKSLLMDNFNFEFDNPNKQFTIEKFSIGVSIHAENGADIFADEYIFDSGYVFDTTFVFAEQTPNDTSTGDDIFYPIVGISEVSELLKLQKDLTKISIIAPKYLEFAMGFGNTLSIFVGNLVSGAGSVVTVGGISTQIVPIVGVANVTITDAQIEKMHLPALITTTLNNNGIPCYGIKYKSEDCEQTLQFRYFTSYGGWAYFHTQKEALTGTRSKTEFINNNFHNIHENKSSRIQRTGDSKKQMSLSGKKQIELTETFIELLNSPKVEILLPRGFSECEVTGNFSVKKFDFEYSLVVIVSNENGISL